MTKHIFITRRRRIFSGERDYGGLRCHASEAARLPRGNAETGPLSQCGSRNHVSVSARRSIRDRRRSGNRSGPRTLRTFFRHPLFQSEQLHDRQDLQHVISRERHGGYLGGTVQVIPHITNEIKSAIASLDSPGLDIAITEIGGTVGDIESLPFLEAIRQFHQDAGEHNSIFLHLTLVPYIRAAGELKTKPSQQSVGILRSIGIIPDVLICPL